MLVDDLDDVSLRYSDGESSGFATKLNKRNEERKKVDRGIEQLRQIEDYAHLLKTDLSELESFAIDKLLEEDLDWPKTFLIHKHISTGLINLDQAAKILVTGSDRPFMHDLKNAIIDWLYDNPNTIPQLCGHFQLHKNSFGMEHSFFRLKQQRGARGLVWALKMRFQKKGDKLRKVEIEKELPVEAQRSALRILFLCFVPETTGADEFRAARVIEMKAKEEVKKISNRKSTKKKKAKK